MGASPVLDPRVDRLGDYRLRKRLAVGGMGEVYLGEKVGPEGFLKPVVLKCVLPQLAKDPSFVQLFLDEARLAALLNHQNIAQVYDFGATDNVYFMAMEYVPGYTVDDLRRKHASINRPMPIEHIGSVASQACQGLHYAHSLADARGVGLGLVHRDVSPHNLMVSVDGTLKILDFGIAKARAGITRVQAKGAVGKFGYMSPEQSRGEQVDARSDVFSLGVCLWEMVTNQRLHDAKIDRPPVYDPRRPVPAVTAFRRDVPRQFERILETALAIDRDDRYANCQEMHLDIERFLAAMTHYAGQAALAQYLKDLAEGRVENPPEPRQSQLVEPAGARRNSTRPTMPSQGLEGAQRYEEVFGIGADRDAPREGVRAVPTSWETRRSSATALEAPSADGPKLELKTGRTPVPQVQSSREMDEARRQRMARAAERDERRSAVRTVALAVLFVGIVAIGAAGVYWRESLATIVENLLAPPPPPTPPDALAARYRITSIPEGAEIWVDGKKHAMPAPAVLELSPGIEYRLEVRKAGLATKYAILKATVGEGVRDLSFKLDPAASVRVTSSPPGAAIDVNGQRVRSLATPVTLDDVPAGPGVRITLTLEGRPPQQRQVDLVAGKAGKVHVDFDER